MPDPHMPRRRLETGEGLEPLEPIDIATKTSINELVRAMSQTAFGGRRVGEAADVLEKMIKDEDCFRVLTLSGAMTVAKQSLVICEMIERGWIQAIISTGALICHGLIEGQGMKHYKRPASSNDFELFLKGYNRVYDTIEPEINFKRVEDIIQDFFMDLRREHPSSPIRISSHDFCVTLGKYLANLDDSNRGILKSAYKHNVSVYIPAITDSELGIDFLVENLTQIKEKGENIENIDPFDDFWLSFDPISDLWHFIREIFKAKKLGVVTIGGGVPRNWAQQIGPLSDIIEKRLNWKFGTRKYAYGIRICPEPVHWGGLSGSTYSEAKSWGKFERDARTAEVLADATIVLPLIVRAVIERLEERGDS
ncbi:MAG: deoxyhypusine synthase family protein [Candidatus Hodarchaeales archaeon]|jgi:deoxyhypusine synthase